MKRKTKTAGKAKAKPSRALVIRKSKSPAAPSAAEEAMRVLYENNAMARETLELQREATALARADAINNIPIPVIGIPKATIDLADTLSAKEAGFIVHLTPQNIYAYIGYVGFAIIPGTYLVSNARLREHWPDKYDEARFWETVRRPVNKERFASLLQPELPMLPETKIG
jgi:hypothetical protein